MAFLQNILNALNNFSNAGHNFLESHTPNLSNTAPVKAINSFNGNSLQNAITKFNQSKLINNPISKALGANPNAKPLTIQQLASNPEQMKSVALGLIGGSDISHIEGNIAEQFAKAGSSNLVKKVASKVGIDLTPELTTKLAAAKTPEEAAFHLQGLPSNYFAQAEAKLKASQGSSAKDILKQQIVDPYHDIKFNPGTQDRTNSYIALNTAPNKARAELEAALQAHNDILKNLRGSNEAKSFEQLRQMRTMQDNLARNLKTPMSADELNTGIRSIQTKLGDRFPVVDQAAKDTTQLFNHVFESLPGISPESKAAIMKANPEYSPLQALKDPVTPNYTPGTNPLNRTNKSSLKGRTGTTGFYNPEQIKVDRQTLANLIQAKHKQSILDNLAQEYGTPIGVRETNNSFLPAPAPKNITDNIPAGMEEFKSRTSDGNIYAVPKRINEIVTKYGENSSNIVTQLFGKSNLLFRAGATTGRIPFIFTNPAGDLGNYAFNRERLPIAVKSGKGKISLADEIMALPHGIASSFKETFRVVDKLAEAQKTAGGEFGGAFGSLPTEIKIPWSVQTTGQKIKGTIAKALALPYNIIAEAGQFTERVPRRAEFYRLQQSGASPERAALAGLDVTANFGRFGDSMKPLNQVVPFINAMVQGNYSTYQAFRKSPITFLIRAGAYAVAPTAALELWNKSTGEDNLVDTTTKENYLYFIIPGKTTTNSSGQTVPVLLRFRKKEFPGFISELTRKIVGGEPVVDTKNIVQDTGMSLLNTITPPIIKAPIEAATNYNMFTQSPIVPQGNQGLIPPLQVNGSTSDTFRSLGESLGVSPARLQQAVTDLFPAISQITPLTDKLSHPQLSQQDKKKTALEQISAYLPFIGVPKGDTGAANKIFDAIQQVQQTKLTNDFLFKQALLSGDMQKASILAKSLTEAQAKALVKSVQDTQAHSNLSPAQKAFEQLSDPDKLKVLDQLGGKSSSLVPGVQAASAADNSTAATFNLQDLINGTSTGVTKDKPYTPTGNLVIDTLNMKSRVSNLNAQITNTAQLAAQGKLDPTEAEAKIVSLQNEAKAFSDKIKASKVTGGTGKKKAKKFSAPALKKVSVKRVSLKSPSLKITVPKIKSKKFTIKKNAKHRLT